MEKAVVLREVVLAGRTASPTDVAHAALQEWIACEKAGKIACYAITAVGRAALKRLLRGPQRPAAGCRGLRRGPDPVPGPKSPRPSTASSPSAR